MPNEKTQPEAKRSLLDLARRDPVAACCEIANDPKRCPAVRRAASDLVILYELLMGG